VSLSNGVGVRVTNPFLFRERVRVRVNTALSMQERIAVRGTTPFL